MLAAGTTPTPEVGLQHAAGHRPILSAAGGYGAPPGGGFGGPPPGGGFGGPQPGGFGGPPPGGFGGPPPGGFGGPPPGGFGGPPPGYGPGGAPPGDLQQRVDRWFMLSIVSLFCGCGLLGIIPILISNNAKDALRRGDYVEAERQIGTARLLCILGYVAFAVVVLIYLIMFIVGFATFGMLR